MAPSLLIAVALVAWSSGLPGATVADPCVVHDVPGPIIRLPINGRSAAAIGAVRLQVWVSADRGRTWEMCGEMGTDCDQFDYTARAGGEYWFAVRYRSQDGTFCPEDQSGLVPQQKVHVARGWVGTRPAASAVRLTDLAAEVDDELTRVELELIRRQLKSLADGEGGPYRAAVALEEVEKLRDRLDKIRTRLRDGGRDAPTGVSCPGPGTPKTVTPYPGPLPVIPPLPSQAPRR